MPQAQLSWQELIEQIASRERAIESAFTLPEYEPFGPYWSKEDIELFLLEISQRTLRELPPGAYENVGAVAVSGITVVSGATLPLDTVGILSAMLQVGPTDTYFKPATRVSASHWYQMLNVSADEFARYALIGGKVVFKGSSLSLTLIEEPALDQWRQDVPILPPAGFDEPRIAWVHEKLMVQDFMPTGRL